MQAHYVVASDVRNLSVLPSGQIGSDHLLVAMRAFLVLFRMALYVQRGQLAKSESLTILFARKTRILALCDGALDLEGLLPRLVNAQSGITAERNSSHAPSYSPLIYKALRASRRHTKSKVRD